MTQCEQMQKNGTCYPGIDKFNPVEFLTKKDESKPGQPDRIPYWWKLRAKVDIPHPNPDFNGALDPPADIVADYWVCEDCHLLCQKNLAATQTNQE